MAWIYVKLWETIKMQKPKSIHEEFRDALIAVGRDIRALNEVQEVHSDRINKVHKLTFAALVLCVITTLICIMLFAIFII